MRARIARHEIVETRSGGNISGNAVLAGASNIAASIGSACHEGGAEVASAFITALGVEESAALGSVRLSLGRSTMAEDIEEAAAALGKAWRRGQ